MAGQQAKLEFEDQKLLSAYKLKLTELTVEGYFLSNENRFKLFPMARKIYLQKKNY